MCCLGLGLRQPLSYAALGLAFCWGQPHLLLLLVALLLTYLIRPFPRNQGLKSRAHGRGRHLGASSAFAFGGFRGPHALGIRAAATPAKFAHVGDTWTKRKSAGCSALSQPRCTSAALIRAARDRGLGVRV